jgi:hypothetical protein
LKKSLILFLWIGLCQSTSVFAQTDIETKKIEFLLHEIEQLKGAKFLRNGSSYTPAEATDYLRMKMKWNDRGRPVRNAQDFINRIASKSNISSKPYMLQMEDGKKVEMKTFLNDKLSQYKE